MDEKHAKVHHKSKHRRGGSSRGNSTEPTSPSKTTATTTPIVIVQSQSHDDEMAESPASSIHVNSKNVQSSGLTDKGKENFDAFFPVLFISCLDFIFIFGIKYACRKNKLMIC